MTKTEIKSILSTLAKLISPAFEVMGLKINNKFKYTFTSGNLDFVLDSVGNYGDYITLEPYFVLHNEKIENFISCNIQKIGHCGLFHVSHRLAKFLDINEFNLTEFNNYDFTEFIYKYKIYNSKNVIECSIDIVKYVQTVGRRIIEISEDDKKLYNFYFNMIKSKHEIITTPNFRPSDLILTFGLEVVYSSIFLGVKNNFGTTEELKIILKEMYKSNEVVINNIDKLSILLQ